MIIRIQVTRTLSASFQPQQVEKVFICISCFSLFFKIWPSGRTVREHSSPDPDYAPPSLRSPIAPSSPCFFECRFSEFCPSQIGNRRWGSGEKHRAFWVGSGRGHDWQRPLPMMAAGGNNDGSGRCQPVFTPYCFT